MKSLLFGLLSLALASLVLGLPIQEDEITPLAEVANYRLTTNVLPWHYNITLKPFLLATDGAKQFTFEGEAYIRINTSLANQNVIVLHSKSLTYTLIELYQTADPTKTVTITSQAADDVTDKVTFNLAASLTAGVNYTMHCKYTGLMEDDMHGFYRSSYVDASNNTKWLGSTQLQSNHARRAFPCFDEPKFKASFDVTLIRHKSFKTTSNTRIVKVEQVDNDYWMDVYATTPIMSSYLLAFLVSEFNERSDGDFAVIARPEFYSQTEYAFDVGRKLLTEFDKYTALPYYKLGVDKMHMAAIPDFSAGAMENWGLLTYRERSLLYDEGQTTLSSKQAIAAVISHEQAHMWFGDLVTCDWWGYTWLNEGFARYFQYFMTAVVHPEWELEKQFTVDQIQAVFTMDSTNNTNPMSDTTAASPSDLSRMFNSISYNKGGAVIRMVKHAMGEANFQKSLQSYLKEFQYKNTVPSNIFTHWKTNWPTATAKNADLLFSTFTEQVGYPVIYVDIATDGLSMTLQQKRFLLKAGDGSDPALLYMVPFTYTTSVNPDFISTTPDIYLEPKTGTTKVEFQSKVSWVIGNIQETGYYRVNYSESAWHGIHHSLKASNWSGVPELNRAQYVDDLFALARAGDLTYTFALGCLDYLDSEIHYIPWTSAFNGLSYLAIRLGVDNENFGYYILEMTAKVYNALGFEEKESDSTLDIYARSKVISWACNHGHEECISTSLKWFRNMNTTTVPVNIRGSVYCTAMRHGTAADFEALYSKLQKETVPTEQVLIINNLGCVRNENLVERVFNIILSDEIRRQDKSSALSGLYTSNAENVSPVFKLVTTHCDALAEAMGSYSAVATQISNIASRFTTKAQETELDEFITASGSKFGSSLSTLKSAQTTVKENLAWDELRLGQVKTYFTKFTAGGAGSVSISVFTVALIAIVSLLFQ